MAQSPLPTVVVVNAKAVMAFDDVSRGGFQTGQGVAQRHGSLRHIAYPVPALVQAYRMPGGHCSASGKLQDRGLAHAGFVHFADRNFRKQTKQTSVAVCRKIQFILDQQRVRKDLGKDLVGSHIASLNIQRQPVPALVQGNFLFNDVLCVQLHRHIERTDQQTVPKLDFDRFAHCGIHSAGAGIPDLKPDILIFGRGIAINIHH